MITASTIVRSKDSRPIRTEEDIALVRQIVKRVSSLLGFSLVNQTKVVTAASEIARNTLEYGGGGEFTIEALDADGRAGVRLTFTDHGPGIPDVRVALQDGYSTAHGMGLGLGGSKRLVDEFEIDSKVGAGTCVVLTKWS